MPHAHSCTPFVLSMSVVTFAQAAFICPTVAQGRADPSKTAIEVLRRTGLHCADEDTAGFLWICTAEGLARYDGRDAVVFGPEAGETRAFLRAADGRVWTAGTEGVFEFVTVPDRGREPHVRGLTLPRDTGAVNSLVEGRNGTIWCATDSGVLRLADGRLDQVDMGLPADPAGSVVHALVVDEVGTLWAGAASGLYVRSEDGRTDRFTTADGLPANDVRAVALDGDGRLWVGTPSGLALIYRGAIERRDQTAVTVFTEQAGLPSHDVRVLHVAGRTLWIGTDDGTAALRSFSTDRLDIERVSRGFSARAVSSTADGNVWVTAEDGVRAYRGSRPRRLPTMITAVRIDGRPEPIPAGGVQRTALSLPWHADLVEIEFVSPRAHMIHGDRVRYQARNTRPADAHAPIRARLDLPPPTSSGTRGGGPSRFEVIPGSLFVPLTQGLFTRRGEVAGAGGSPVVLRQFRHEGPSPFNARSAAYPGADGWLTLPEETQLRAVIEHPAKTLARGQHRFDVHASASPIRNFLRPASASFGQSASIEMTVAVAPWVRWWFLAPVGLAAAGLAFGWRQQRAQRGREIARVRSRIAADLHDSVGASLTRIAILSDVASQRAQGRLHDVVPELQAIGDNARNVIDEMNDAVWFIDPAAADLRALLVRIRTAGTALFDPSGIDWRAEAPGDVLDLRLSSNQRRHIYLIVKEALTNARRHAHPSHVAIRIHRRDRMLRIDVDDDGVGMPAAGEGRGIENMRMRARDLGGTLRVGPRTDGPGTRVTLEVPWR